MRGDPEHNKARGEQNPEQSRKIRQAEIAHQHLELAQSPETNKFEADDPDEHEQKSPFGFLRHSKVKSKLIPQPKTADQRGSVGQDKADASKAHGNEIPVK